MMERRSQGGGRMTNLLGGKYFTATATGMRGISESLVDKVMERIIMPTTEDFTEDHGKIATNMAKTYRSIIKMVTSIVDQW